MLGSTRTHLSPLLLLLPFAFLAAGCGDSAEPVGKVALDATELTLPYPESREAQITWRPSTPLGGSDGAAPLVFVHLLNAEGRLERTFDHPLPRPWRPGQEISYPLSIYQSMLGPPLPPGEYRLTVGLYGPDGRWPLSAAGAGDEATGDREYPVATVTVPPVIRDELPRLGFVGDWTPLEPGTDQQVLGSRWLGREGSIAVQEVATAGRLGLLFELPPPPEGVARVMEEGAAEPALRLDSTCDGSEHSVSGTGRSPVKLAVPAGRACEIRLRPNYRFDHPELGSRAVRLLRVTWDPRDG